MNECLNMCVPQVGVPSRLYFCLTPGVLSVLIRHDLDQDQSVTNHERMNKYCQLRTWQMAGALASLQGGTLLPCFPSNGRGSLEKRSILGKNHQYRPQFVKSATAVFRLILLNVSIREDYLLSNNST